MRLLSYAAAAAALIYVIRRVRGAFSPATGGAGVSLRVTVALVQMVALHLVIASLVGAAAGAVAFLAALVAALVPRPARGTETTARADVAVARHPAGV